jgi:hypothetical protein
MGDRRGSRAEARKRVRKEHLREVLGVLLDELEEASRAFQSAWRRAKENPQDEEAWGELQVWVSVLGVKAQALEELLEEEALLTS